MKQGEGMQIRSTTLNRIGQGLAVAAAAGVIATIGVTSAQASTATGLEATAPATVIKTGYGFDGLDAAHWRWGALPNVVTGAGPGFWEGNPFYSMFSLAELIKQG